MSKADILEELPKLEPGDRREVLSRLFELEERDVVSGVLPAPEDRALLDREIEDFEREPPGAGSTWPVVLDRVRRATVR